MSVRVAASCLSLLAIMWASPAVAQDTLTFDDGSVLVGRIERLSQGQLVVDVPIADGDIFVDWSRVTRIDSQRDFQFQTAEGERFLGRFQLEGDLTRDTLVVDVDGVTRTYRRGEIVSIVETVGQLTGLLTNSIGAGLTLTKSNDYRQLNVDGSIAYETTSYRLSATGSSILSRQREAEDTNRHNAIFQFTRNLRSRLGLSFINSYLRNDEQSLDLRTIVGGGPQVTILRNSQIELVTVGGVVWNNERYDPEASLETNNDLEGLLGISLSFFRFNQWELQSSYQLFPSITSSGRIRQSVDAKLRLRLVRGKSFWLNFSQTLDFDNEPPEGTPGTDFVTTASLSWSFP